MPGTVSYAPSYQDYVNAFNQANTYVTDDTGRTAVNGTPLTQDAWNALGDDAKWQTYSAQAAPNLFGTPIYRVSQDSPFYADLAQRTGAEPGRLIIAHGKPTTTGWVDPSKVIDLGNGTYAYAENNQTPEIEHQMHPSAHMPMWAAAWLAAMGGVAALGGSTLDGLAAANPGAVGAGEANIGATGIGSMGATEATSAAAAGTTAASAGGTTPGMIAPGMEGQATAESTLLNQGVVPGTPAWIDALSSQGLDTTAGANALDPLTGTQDSSIPDTEGLPGSGDPGAEPSPQGTENFAPVEDHSVDAGFMDNLRNVVPGGAKIASVLAKLPGIAGALKPLLTPVPRGGGAGDGTASQQTAGATRPLRPGDPTQVENPYLKAAQQAQAVGSLMSYIRNGGVL